MQKNLRVVKPEYYFIKQIEIYENLYNQELETRRSFDNKMVSRISIISAELFLMGQILEYIINAKLYLSVSFISLFFYILCVLLIVQAVLFYKAFFRFKKNYKEVSPEEIRMFHLKCAQDKMRYNRRIRYKIISNEEIELVTYLKDSYQFCTYHNVKTNLKRAKSLDYFDNATIIIVFPLIIIFLSLYYIQGGSI